MKKFIFILLLLLPLISAQEVDFWQYNSQEVDTVVRLSSGLQLEFKDSDSYVEHALAQVYFSPQEVYSQDIMDLKVNPDPLRTQEYFEFFWNEPGHEVLDFEIEAQVKSRVNYRPIKRKIAFPLSSLPPDVLKYTNPSEHINSDDPLIHELASDLAQGKSDLYDVVFTIAQWTNENIEYNLSTLTEDVSQSASWTLQNRYGVCDELTSLFIAQLRSLGIPAKFISGIAYTDSDLFDEEWGAHGWAEVYFPTVGWVAWDVTYGEYGFVDPTHIKLSESIDSAQSATVFSWLGRDVSGIALPIDLSADLIKHTGKVADSIDLTLDVYDYSIGFNSANLIQVNVKNLLDSYLSPTVILTQVNELEYSKDPVQTIFLEPFEVKTISWIVQTPTNLDKDFIYTIPLQVRGLQGGFDKDTFVITPGESQVNYALLESLVASQESIEELSGSANVKCIAQKEFHYVDDEVIFDCTIKNDGTTILEDLLVCLNESCQTTDLLLNEQSSLTFNLGLLEEGFNQLPIQIKHEFVDSLTLMEVLVLDDPKIKISISKLDRQIEYEESQILEFTLEPVSNSPALKTVVQVELGSSTEKFEFDTLESTEKIQLQFTGQILDVGANTGDIIVSYEDLKGHKYEIVKTVEIELVNVSVWQRIQIILKKLF